MPDEGDSRIRPNSHGAQIVPVSLDTLRDFGTNLELYNKTLRLLAVGM